MAHLSRTNCLIATLLVAFMISGCQSSNGKWATAWNERTKPKQKFQGVEGPEEVTYWPNKPSKTNSTPTEVPSRLKDKMARKAEQSKRESQLAELIKDGDQLRKNSQWEDARLVYTKALLISPDNADVHHRLAIIADKQGQFSTADDHYLAALKARPQDANLLSDRGYSYYLRGNNQQAEATLKDALAINKSHKGAMANLGAVYAKQNRYQDASEIFRNGATEAEAQQSMARLFPQGNSATGAGTIANQGNLPSGPMVASQTENPRDLSQWSEEQVRTEMARRKLESEQRRQLADQQASNQARILAANEAIGQQQIASANPNNLRTNSPMPLGPQGGYPSGNQNGSGMPQRQLDMTQIPDSNGQGQIANLPYSNGQGQIGNFPQSARSNISTMPDQQMANAGSNFSQPAKVFRGSGNPSQSFRPNDPQVQQAWDQQPQNSVPNGIAPVNGSSSASQIATHLGMSAGPGSMFPIVQGSAANTAIPAGPSASVNNRFGGDFLRTPNSQTARNWSGDSIMQTSESSSNSGGKDAGQPPIAPASPINNWGTPATGGFNWQNDSTNNWDRPNENQATVGAGNGINSQNVQVSWGQNAGRQTATFDNLQPAINSNGPQNNGEASRPFNGAWPNSNSIPQQQQNPNVSTNNNRSPESLEMMGIYPLNGGAASAIQNGNGGNPFDASSNSPPRYPFNPNR